MDLRNNHRSNRTGGGLKTRIERGLPCQILKGCFAPGAAITEQKDRQVTYVAQVMVIVQRMLHKLRTLPVAAPSCPAKRVQLRYVLKNVSHRLCAALEDFVGVKHVQTELMLQTLQLHAWQSQI